MNEDKEFIGKKAKAVPVEEPEIGVETDNATMLKLLDAAEEGNLDTASLESFNSASQSREYVYSFIDSMALDDRVSSVLEVYASDAVETNDDGKIVWCESSDGNLVKTVNFLLDSINVDKHAYEWMYSLIKYGDLYLKMFRQSEVNDCKDTDDEKDRSLRESVSAIVHEPNSHYAHYVEMVPNPGEMFDLTEFGKTVLYIQAPTTVQNTINQDSPVYAYQSYKMKQSDVTVYGAQDFVHASLANENSLRSPEEVSIFQSDEDFQNDSNGKKYVVKKGQSMLYNLFKVWRQLSLIEDSLIVNRATRSSLVRLMQINVGDMPAEQVKDYLQRIKNIIEQKSAMSIGKGIQEYNNPSPVENIVYVPVHGDQGVITSANIGGDYDPKSLTDLDYFINKYYGSVGIPKQYFGNTDDAAGFNGGSSLAIISSRYGKNVKKYQNIFCQMITDVINLFLIDKGMSNKIGKFTIRMQAPLTQEELDKRENLRNRMGVVNDVMSQISGVVNDETLKLKILKELLSQTLSDTNVVTLLQEHIDKLEESAEKGVLEGEAEDGDEEPVEREERNERPSRSMSDGPASFSDEESLPEPEGIAEFEGDNSPDSYLPSPSELGVSMVDNI